MFADKGEDMFRVFGFWGFMVFCFAGTKPIGRLNISDGLFYCQTELHFEFLFQAFDARAQVAAHDFGHTVALAGH